MHLLDERVIDIQHLFAKYGKRVLLPSALVVILLLWIFNGEEEQTSFDLISEATPQTVLSTESESVEASPEMTETVQSVYVDVKGAVKYPGVYSFTTEDRITDAIQAAGGYTEQANPQLINHAQKLQDEMVIYVPQIGEEVPDMVATQTATSGPSSDVGKININKADATQLTTLPGVGPSKAAAIIAHREDKGAFQTIDHLKDVTGIGDKTFEQLKDLIDIK